MSKCGIYTIENLSNGLIYVGQSVNLPQRKATHFSSLRKNNHKNSHLQNSFNKYGEDSFVFKEILYCESFELTRYEEKLDQKYKTHTYNIRPCANSNKGIKHSLEFKKKIRDSLIGRKHSEETKKRIAKSNSKPLSEERKQKISKSLMGNKPWNKGIPRTEECKQKISNTKKHFNRKNKVIFWDRDGVINEVEIVNKKPYPPIHFYDIKIMVGIREVLAILSKMGYLNIVITNQPDWKKGKADKKDIESINKFLEENLPIDDFYVCYHIEEDNCSCRKPKTGLLLEACKKYNIDFSKSWMIGDRWKDMEAGRKVGCKTIFIDYGYDEKQPDAKDVDITIKDVTEIVEVISRHDN